jgi:predicted HD phosphohydrolase
MSLTLPEVVSLLQRRGQNQYGMEAINQLEHALQCADLAEKAGETPETVVASLLHDLGHLLAAEREGLKEHNSEQDDLHQYIALPFIRTLFPDAVLEPIRLHVDAKRYLCLIDPGYWADLSPASKHSLEHRAGYSASQRPKPSLHNLLRLKQCACAATTTWPKCPPSRCLTWRTTTPTYNKWR